MIIGNGIAGVTTARHLRKLSDERITIISDESPYFFARTALMYVFMGHMRQSDTYPQQKDFWRKNRFELIHERVDSLDHENNALLLSSGDTVKYDRLVLATGSKPRRLNIPGEELEAVRSLYHLQDIYRILERRL